MHRDFYPVQRLLSNVETLIRCIIFFQCVDFSAVCRLLFGEENFIQCRDFYIVSKLLCLIKTFIQCGDFYQIKRQSCVPVQKLIQCGRIFLCSVETLFTRRDFYPVQKRFSLTKQRTIARTETTIWDFKKYNCSQIIVKEY